MNTGSMWAQSRMKGSAIASSNPRRLPATGLPTAWWTGLLQMPGLNRGRLQLLEYLLQELWKNRDRDEFAHKGYEKAGGVTGAIAKRPASRFPWHVRKCSPVHPV